MAQQPEQIDMMCFKRRLPSSAFGRCFKLGSVMAAAVVVSPTEPSLSSMSAKFSMAGVAGLGSLAAAAGARSAPPAAHK